MRSPPARKPPPETGANWLRFLGFRPELCRKHPEIAPKAHRHRPPAVQPLRSRRFGEDTPHQPLPLNGSRTSRPAPAVNGFCSLSASVARARERDRNHSVRGVDPEPPSLGSFRARAITRARLPIRAVKSPTESHTNSGLVLGGLRRREADARVPGLPSKPPTAPATESLPGSVGGVLPLAGRTARQTPLSWVKGRVAMHCGHWER